MNHLALLVLEWLKTPAPKWAVALISGGLSYLCLWHGLR